MRCKTCRYCNHDDFCWNCDGYDNYQPTREEYERLERERDMANDQEEKYYVEC